MKERSSQCAQYGPRDHGGLSGECVEFVGGEVDINMPGRQREDNKKLPTCLWHCKMFSPVQGWYLRNVE